MECRRGRVARKGTSLSLSRSYLHETHADKSIFGCRVLPSMDRSGTSFPRPSRLEATTSADSDGSASSVSRKLRDCLPVADPLTSLSICRNVRPQERRSRRRRNGFSVQARAFGRSARVALSKEGVRHPLPRLGVELCGKQLRTFSSPRPFRRALSTLAPATFRSLYLTLSPAPVCHILSTLIPSIRHASRTTAFPPGRSFLLGALRNISSHPLI